MEKRGVIKPGTTPDVENKLDKQKTASTSEAIKQLDDDATKRLADGFAKPKGGKR